MKDIILSNCEKSFILKAAEQGTRLDGRNLDEWRSLKIALGSEWGSCHVSLGNTKVVSNITCKVSLPKQTRPNEGMLFVNLELGTMGAPNFEANRQSDLSVYLNRLIEKCLRDSKCVDLESLCIVAEEKVWVLRIDIHVLNHSGNLIECASIAALTSLAHFKRPDITTSGEEIVIHTLSEKDPIPIVLHHYPICVTFGIFNDGTIIADPNLIEESVCHNNGALLVVGMNPYREVCLFDLSGVTVNYGSEVIYKGTKKAVNRVQHVVKEIKEALLQDSTVRSSGKPIGFANAIPTNELMSLSVDKLFLRLKKFNFNMDDIEMDVGTIAEAEMNSERSSSDEEVSIVSDGNVTALISKDQKKEKEIKKWATMDENKGTDLDNENQMQEEEVQLVNVITPDDRIVAKIHVSSDSEENDVVILLPEKKHSKAKKKKSKH